MAPLPVRPVLHLFAPCDLIIQRPRWVIMSRSPLQVMTALLLRLLFDRQDHFTRVAVTAEFLIDVQVCLD
jgi:hypothetical protein